MKSDNTCLYNFVSSAQIVAYWKSFFCGSCIASLLKSYYLVKWLPIVELMKVIMGILLLKADVITNVSRLERF